MRFAGVIATVLATAATVAATANGAAIVKDLHTVNATLYKLNATVSTLTVDDPTGAAVVETIQKESNKIIASLEAAIKAANSSSLLSHKSTDNVVTITLNLVQPINTTLNNIIAHQKSFATAIALTGDVSLTVDASLKTQKNLTIELGAALGPILQPPFNTLAPAQANNIAALFDNAIAVFSKCTGVICLPPMSS